MSINIQLYKNDLPDDFKLGNTSLAVDGEFMGLNVRRDPLCLIQISSGNSDAHIIQLDRQTYNAPNLIKILSDENIKKIFEAFSQEDTSTTRKFGGTGLGLTIANKLLGLMNSYIKVDSSIGNGSLFYFDVLLQSDTSIEPILDTTSTYLEQSAEEGTFSSDLTILVAEDNPINMLLARTIFKKINKKGK